MGAALLDCLSRHRIYHRWEQRGIFYCADIHGNDVLQLFLSFFLSFHLSFLVIYFLDFLHWFPILSVMSFVYIFLICPINMDTNNTPATLLHEAIYHNQNIVRGPIRMTLVSTYKYIVFHRAFHSSEIRTIKVQVEYRGKKWKVMAR